MTAAGGDPESVKRRVRERFAASAQAYVESAGHAAGDDLALLASLARPRPHERALDVATGGGHTALALSRHVRQVVATDLTEEMLAAARTFALGRGATNIEFRLADAEELPFEDASFDLVTSRIAPHHFPNPERFVAESARVLKPGGRLVVDDNMAPEDPELDAFMNRFEAWRDPSHVRAWAPSQWTRWIAKSGLTVLHVEPLAFKRHPYRQWTRRAGMSEAEAAALAAWMLRGPARCREYFRIEVGPDGELEAISATWSVIAAARPVTLGGRPARPP